MRTIAKFLSITFVVVAAMGCGGPPRPDTPRSAMPAELTGRWFTGTLSTIQYYDRNTGQFLDPSGEGFYFVFGENGDYETGAVINSTVAGCTMRLLGSEAGTAVSEGDGRLTLYRHYITTHVTNSCGNSGERTEGQETKIVTWSIDPDDNGLPWLSLVHDDGATERYRPWER